MTHYNDKVIYVVLIGLALLSWWLVKDIGLDDPTKTKRDGKTPDFFSKGYRKWEMDETGKLKSRLVAEEMSHFPVYWATHTKKPVMEFINAQKPPWVIASATGILSKDGKQLQLNGEVKITRPKAEGYREVIINTSNLKVNPETSYAETKAWAELISPPNITTGIGMKAIFKEPIHLELLSKVKGRYDTQ